MKGGALGGATSPLPLIVRQAVAEDGDPPSVRSCLGGATSPLPLSKEKREKRI